ncbi:class I SAM-dependent methyltransferase [Streptomyces sp. NPDC055099]
MHTTTHEKHPFGEWSQRQIAYYRARASEYDASYAERMRMPQLKKALDTWPIGGDVLELACGTGQWTQLLSRRTNNLTALDAAPEMLDVARGQMQNTATRFIEADIFRWEPDRQYDTVFFAFWLSHVPPAEMASFWDMLRLALKPGGRVVFLDDSRAKAEIEEQVPEEQVPTVLRTLADGTQHLAVKVLHDSAGLTRQLNDLGWEAHVEQFDPYHVGGIARPRSHK